VQLSGDSALARNYTVTQPENLKADITGRTLTAILTEAISKIYDGNTTATLTASNYRLGNLVAGESAAVSKTSGTYDSSNVLAAKNVSTTLAVGDFVAGSGTALSNYILPTSASGSASITARTLTAILTGAISKIYDGNDMATLTGSNYKLDLVAGDSATVSKTAGLYNSANVLGASSASTTLAAGDFTAANGTALSNYILPTSASGSAGITARPLTVDAIAKNKVYDGNAIATLTGADGGAVKITGLAGNETLSLSGQFDNKNVGNGKPVTVSSVALTGDTGLVSNYMLMPLNLTADITAPDVVFPVSLSGLTSIVNPVLRLSPQVMVTGGLDFVSIVDASEVTVGNALALAPEGVRFVGASISTDPSDGTANVSVASIAGASEAKVVNAAEWSLSMESPTWSEKITPSTMLGLNVLLGVVDGGLQLNNLNINTEDNK
jgi:hypothetical protein